MWILNLTSARQDLQYRISELAFKKVKRRNNSQPMQNITRVAEADFARIWMREGESQQQ